MDTQSIFRCLDFFILRTPILSTNVFENKLTSFKAPILDELWEFTQDPLIREAIAVSSISLLDALTYLSPDSPIRKREQVAKAFLRYLIRMSTRPTPFGLFSGVAYGEYGEYYNVALRSTKYHEKRTRPDMEWLFKIISQLENDSNVIKQLLVMTNTMAYEVGNRTYLPYLTNIGQAPKSGTDFEMESTSVRTTSAVKQALEFAKTPLTYEELISKLNCEYRDTPHEQINQFVYQLFKQEMLISNLRPPLIEVNPLSYLLEQIEHIKGIDKLKNQLQEISFMIDMYDRAQLGEGEELYRNIIKKMKKIADSKNLLQVDLRVQTNEVVLPISVKQEVEKVAGVLWKISNNELGLSHMNEYRNEFLKKYGMEREVPLLELLDEDIGLGAPATYEYPLSKRMIGENKTEFLQRKKYLLSQWLTMSLLKGEQEILLDDDKVAELVGEEIDTRYVPRSFELYFSLVADSKEAMEAGDYKLISGATALSYGAGRSIGRFADIMSCEFQDKLKSIGVSEQEMCSDTVLAELVYLPVDGRAANIVLTYGNRNHEIVMGTTSSKEVENTIPLSDLVVGVDEKGFYLRSLKLGKEVIAVTNHMFNASNSPNVYRFLRELAQERQRNIEIFHWGEFNSLPFLPRIKYGRCVLSPARWILNEQTFPFKANSNKDEWINEFHTYKKEWRLPRYVYLTQTDNRLLLDLDENVHIDEIRREFGKISFGKGIILTEMGHTMEELPANDNNRYYNEFVFPIIRNSMLDNRIMIPDKKCRPITYSERYKFPGSEWMFIKWYGLGNRTEEFLGGQLREFCHMAEQNGWVKSSFFMRYADPDKHIRLRFFGEPEKLQSELLPQINKFANNCLQEGMLSRMVIDTYDPEIERYGGRELIKIAEQWFCIDSRIIMDWIKLSEQGHLPIEKDLLAVISIIDIMEQFGITFEDQLAFLDKIVNYKDYLDLFRAKRSIYTKLGDSRDGFANLKKHDAGRFLLPAFQARGHVLNYYGEQLAKREQSEEYYIKGLDVMHSIIHIHINRLYGINRSDETRILTLTRHTLHNLVYIRRR
ncbi:lantibiotic dehydratase [Vallitalea sediminicola]